MSYSAVVEIANSNSLRQRVVAAAAEQGLSQPDLWVQQRMWQIAASPGWDDAWDYAKGVYESKFNPDTGARNDVINDEMILSAVQAAVTAEATV